MRKFLNYEDQKYTRNRISSYITSAVKSGKLIRENTQAHHWSYQKDHRLNVDWLSRKDHMLIHKLCRELNWYFDI